MHLPFSSKVISRNPNFARWYATEQPIAPPPQTTTCDEAGRGRSPSVRQRTDCLKLFHRRDPRLHPDRAMLRVILCRALPCGCGNSVARAAYRIDMRMRSAKTKKRAGSSVFTYVRVEVMLDHAAKTDHVLHRPPPR